MVSQAPILRRSLLTLLAAALLAGCSPFSVKGAREVDRDRLLVLSEQGKNDHLRYMGSDSAYHYVVDSRSESGRTYKVRADQIALEDTFRVGDDDSYVLWPQLIEGKKLGKKPQPMGEFPQRPADSQGGL